MTVRLLELNNSIVVRLMHTILGDVATSKNQFFHTAKFCLQCIVVKNLISSTEEVNSDGLQRGYRSVVTLRTPVQFSKNAIFKIKTNIN